MRPLLSLTLLVAAWHLPAFADVTFRNVMEMKSPMMPAGAAGGAAMPFGTPRETVCKIKGTRAYTTFGPMAAIMDSASGQVTLLDTAGKRYAVTTLSDYLAQIAQSVSGALPQQMPEAARQIFANIQFKVQSRDTGKSERIQGIDAGESETTLSISIPLPIPMPSDSGSSGMEMTGIIQLWKPNPGEINRLPALREINAYYEHFGKMGGSIADTMKQMFSAFPGMGDKLNELTAVFEKGSPVTLRMHAAFTMPALAAMMKMAKPAGGDASNASSAPDSPLFEITSDLKDVDTSPVPDSVFQIPEGYQKAPVEDLLKGLLPALK